MKEKNQLIKGILVTLVLKLLQDNVRMYGYEITKKVKESSGGNIVITEGALYPTLHRLEAEGLIFSTIESIGNRTRKYYQLTQEGGKEAEDKVADLFEFVNHLQSIFNLKPSF
jgi:DNA-binding PadR family transcriptional regulator